MKYHSYGMQTATLGSPVRSSIPTIQYLILPITVPRDAGFVEEKAMLV
jgi:hypothetical protein